MKVSCHCGDSAIATVSCPYRAVDSKGNTIDFLLTARRDAEAAKRFFMSALKATHTQKSRVINVDKNPW